MNNSGISAPNTKADNTITKSVGLVLKIPTCWTLGKNKKNKASYITIHWILKYSVWSLFNGLTNGLNFYIKERHPTIPSKDTLSQGQLITKAF